MAEYAEGGEAEYTDDQYPGQDPYEGVEVEGYTEQENNGNNQEDFSQDNSQRNT